MNHINRIIFSVIGVALLILSWGSCCKANPVGPITFGVPFTFDMSVDAGVDVSGALNGHDELATASLQLADILVVNAGGHPLRNIHFTSGSGTLYPLDAANTLPGPEPSSLSLLGFGLVTLVFATSRKRFGLQSLHPR